MITVEKIKAREKQLEEKKAERRARRIKQTAKRILKLRARGIIFIGADSALGEKIYKLSGFCCSGDNTLYAELLRLGIELFEKNNNIFIKIK